MSGNRLLLDSNIAIYLSKQTLSVRDFAESGDTLFVSLVTYMEVTGYTFTDQEEELFINTLFITLQRLPVTQTIADRVVAYRKRRKVKLPDAIILATAYEYDCSLVTRNVDDFAGLDEKVTIINPFDKH